MLDKIVVALIESKEERTDQRVSLLCLFMGAFLLLFGLTSYLIRGRFYLTTAPLALLCGITLGPRGARVLWILPQSWESASESDKAKETLLWLTRIVLGIQVLSAGVTLPSRHFMKPRMWRSLLTLLGPIMLSAVLICGLFAKAIFPGISWLEAFLVGACLAPTDPVLAASVVKGTFAERHVPPFIRDLLLCESGINDGAATPYLMLPLLILTSASPAKEYFLSALVRETILGMVGGFALGTVLRYAWDFAKARKWVDKESRLVWTLAMALFTIGLFTFIDSNELMACYFCGSAMNWNGHLHEDDLHNHFSEGIDALMDVAVFTTLGTVLPWDLWHITDQPSSLSRLVLFGIAVILLRRLPTVVILQRFIPEIRSSREAAFVGWFGPMGIGALYYALKSAQEMDPELYLKKQLFATVSFVIFISTFIHGTTVPLFALGSAINPRFHPKFLVNDEGGPSETTSLISGESSRPRGKKDENEGEPITRAELERIMNGGDTESLDSRQEEAIIGRGSGLEDWGRGRVTVFREGNKLIICDQEGELTSGHRADG